MAPLHITNVLPVVRYSLLHFNCLSYKRGARGERKYFSPLEPLRIALFALAALGCVLAAAGLGITACCAKTPSARKAFQLNALICAKVSLVHLLSPLIYTVQLLVIPLFLLISTGCLLSLRPALAGRFLALSFAAPFAEVAFSALEPKITTSLEFTES